MALISPPKYVISVLDTLERSGFEAYLVGGGVRDALMGRRPQDWDVCTSAPPERVMQLFPRAHPTGISHGTVTVISSGHRVEVTTYRSDGRYPDHRRPQSVEFVGSLTEDLQRRDFTVNAIAMSRDGELTDPFGGQADIARGIIRCVGAPEKRFDEDALRMLRALRFSAVLGFEIERETYFAIESRAALTGLLAAERIRAELEKTLCSKKPETVARMISLGLLCRVLDPVRSDLDLSALSALPRTAELRFAGLCAILTRDGVIAESEAFLKALRLDRASVKNISAGVAAALAGAPDKEADWKRLSARLGDEGCFCAAAAARALGQGDCLSLWRRVLRQNECRSVAGLDISGGDLLELGLRGSDIGRGLDVLLEHVIERPQENEHERLMEIARRLPF